MARFFHDCSKSCNSTEGICDTGRLNIGFVGFPIGPADDGQRQQSVVTSRMKKRKFLKILREENMTCDNKTDFVDLSRFIQHVGFVTWIY